MSYYAGKCVIQMFNNTILLNEAFQFHIADFVGHQNLRHFHSFYGLFLEQRLREGAGGVIS